MHLGGSAPLFSVIQIPNTGTLWQDIEDFLPNIESGQYRIWRKKSFTTCGREVLYGVFCQQELCFLLRQSLLIPNEDAGAYPCLRIIPKLFD